MSNKAGNKKSTMSSFDITSGKEETKRSKKKKHDQEPLLSQKKSITNNFGYN